MLNKKDRNFWKGAAGCYLFFVLISFSIVLPVFTIFEFEFKHTVYVYLSFQPLLYVLGMVFEAEIEIRKREFKNAKQDFDGLFNNQTTEIQKLNRKNLC